MARSSDDGATWSDPAPLNSNAASNGGNHSSPAITTDGEENWIAAWHSVDPLGDHFGKGVTELGDLDGDGVGDVAVGASRDDDGGLDRGAVWILFLNANGTVKTHQKISDTDGRFTGVLAVDLGTDADILYARSTDGGATWTPPAPLNLNAGSDLEHDWSVQVQAGGPGTWIAVWNSEDSFAGTIGTDLDILVSRSTDDGLTWSAPVALNANANVDDEDDRYPQVATDQLGKWVAVWQYEDPR